MSKTYASHLTKIFFIAILSFFLVNCGDKKEEKPNINLDLSSLEANLTSALADAAVKAGGQLLPTDLANLLVGSDTSVATVISAISSYVSGSDSSFSLGDTNFSITDLALSGFTDGAGNLVTRENIDTVTELVFGKDSTVTATVSVIGGVWDGVSEVVDFFNFGN